MTNPPERFTLPEGAWDCHVHVFDPGFAYAAARDYTPAPATAATLRAHHGDWGVRHAVVVQASVQGTDTGALLDALRRLGRDARGVAVVDPDSVSDAELSDLYAAGVRGIRVNRVAGARGASDDFARMADRLRGGPLFLQVYAPLGEILAHRATIEGAGVPVVLDHFAGCGAEGVGPLDGLLRDAPVWVKLSADYRVTGDVPALIRAFHAQIPERLIWGSDWPHTGGGAARRQRPITEIEPFRQVDPLSVPKRLIAAGLSEAARRAILIDNPARLFDAPAA